jgi:hypothetical protein
LAAQDAKNRIPWYLRGRVTFFSGYDLWTYHLGVSESGPCPICAARENLEEYDGAALRTLFPYLEIVDEDTIMVNEHVNCVCFLSRSGFNEL